MTHSSVVGVVFLLGWLFVGIVTPRVHAREPEKMFTLAQLIEIALQRNPSMESAQQQVLAMQAKVTQATSGYLPQLSTEVEYGVQRWDSGSMAYSIPGNPYSGKDLATTAAGVSISQYLYDFGLTEGKVEESRQNLKVQHKQLAQTAAEVVLDVSMFFYEVLKREHLVGVNQESLDVQEKHLVRARAFYEEGLRPKKDVTKFEVEVANTRLDFIRARYALRSAGVALENVLGGPPVQGEYGLAETVERPAVPGEVESRVAEALGRRPEVARLKAQLKATEARLTTARAGYWPQLSAGASYNWQNSDMPTPDQNTWQVGLKAQWTVFDGFKTPGGVKEALAGRDQTRADMRKTDLAISREVLEATLEVQHAAESIQAAEVALRDAGENMDLAEGRYNTGVGDAIEYSDARLSLTKAKSSLVQANYGYFQAHARLDRAMGRGPGLKDEKSKE